MSIGSLAVAEDWLDAANRGDGARMEELTHEHIEIVGPRGSGRADREVLTQWLTRAGFSAESLRWFCGADGSVVVEQDARWVDPTTGAEQSRVRIGSQFLITDTRVAKYVRHDAGLTPALAAAGLGPHDEVTRRQAD